MCTRTHTHTHTPILRHTSILMGSWKRFLLNLRLRFGHSFSNSFAIFFRCLSNLAAYLWATSAISSWTNFIPGSSRIIVMFCLCTTEQLCVIFYSAFSALLKYYFFRHNPITDGHIGKPVLTIVYIGSTLFPRDTTLTWYPRAANITISSTFNWFLFVIMRFLLDIEEEEEEEE